MIVVFCGGVRGGGRTYMSVITGEAAPVKRASPFVLTPEGNLKSLVLTLQQEHHQLHCREVGERRTHVHKSAHM